MADSFARVNPVVRLCLIGLVVVALLGLGAYADASYEDRWPYPTGDHIVTEYEAHVGEAALVFGTVEAVDGSTGQIRVTTASGSTTLTVRNFDVSVQPGGSVQVFGRLESDRIVTATNVAVVNPSGSSDRYKYAVSLVAVGVFLVGFFRHWRVNLGTLQLEARHDG